MANKVEAKNIFKIFGNEPDRVFEMVSKGHSKADIHAETGHTIGVNDASFEVAEGEVFVVMGLSGSGKSTLVRMINGLIPPTRGQMMIDGVDVASCSAETLRKVRREKVAMVFQHFALFPHKTVIDNVAYGLKVKGLPAAERRERSMKALAQVGLETYADSYPEELSGGMQQRVGLARGLATEPEILLMDEPFGALDPLIRRDMQLELLELQRSLKKTIVFITHDLNEALILGDKIAIMKDGSFVQVGTAEEIVGEPADEYVRAFTQDIDRSRVFEVAAIARPPISIEIGASVAETLAHMEAESADALFVTENGTLRGQVFYRGLSGSENTDALAQHLDADFATVTPDAHLHELYGKAAAGRPIAVVDETGAFTGIVEPGDIFQQLVRGEEHESAPTRAATA